MDDIIKNAEHLGDIGVDSGQIQLGDCDEIQLAVPTVYGDGIYPVFKTADGYIIIDVDMRRVMER